MEFNKVHNQNETLYLTKNEYERFKDLKLKFKNAMSPGEANYYKNEIELMIEMGRMKR